MKLSALKIDLNKANDGIWVPFAEGIELRVARLGNPKMEEYLQKSAPKKARPWEKRDAVAEATMESVEFKQAVATYVLLDWKNVEDDEGKPIPYSPEVALKYFQDPAFGDFYRFVLGISLEQAAFRVDGIEDMKGN